MSDRGFIAVDRGIFDHPLFEDKGEFSRREAWLWLLCEAEWKSRVKSNGPAKISLERGQLAHSIRFIGAAWNWHKSKVERFLGRLRTETMIETRTETGLTIITICNYEVYQSPLKSIRDSSKKRSETGPRQHRDKQKEINKITNTSSNEEEEVGVRDQFALVVAAYGEMASKAGLPAIAALNDKRKASISARISEHGLEAVLRAIGKLGQSDFCCGRGPKGWKADFDFVLQPSSMIRILEGKYDNRVVVEPEKPQDLADLFNRRAEEERRQAEGYDNGRTIEGSYDSGDFDGPRQALPSPAASQGQPGGTGRIISHRLPQGDEARDRYDGGEVDPGRAGEALALIRTVASGISSRNSR